MPLKKVFDCFEANIENKRIHEINKTVSLLIENEQLQIIFLKLWDLGKYVRCNTILAKLDTA